MNTLAITRPGLEALVRDLLAAQTTVVAPARARGGSDAIEYRPIRAAQELALEARLPRLSLKELFLPATEPLFCWRQQKAAITLEEVPTTFPAAVILGARPCDAAALEILDRLMGWDYRDELWFGRREATTVVSLACPGGDGSCFCTSVGLSPSSTRGADCLLTPIGEGYLVDLLTPRGERLHQQHQAHFGPAREIEQAGAFRARAKEQVRVLPARPERVRGWLEAHFEDPLWRGIALRCHGCGACACVCPTCHCFDIVDEPEGIGRGTRRRNWDTCQTALFTLHGSGHNPRRDQSARLRQRVMHKFATFPQRFGETLCTGCGRCARTCAAGVDLLEILQQIDRAAEPAGGDAR